VADTARYENPQQHAKGVPFVLVYGAVVIGHSNHTGAWPAEYGPGESSGS
jgi:hypothetical protein